MKLNSKKYRLKPLNILIYKYPKKLVKKISWNPATTAKCRICRTFRRNYRFCRKCRTVAGLACKDSFSHKL